MSGKFEKPENRRNSRILTVCVVVMILLVVALLAWAVLRSVGDTTDDDAFNGQTIPEGTILSESVDMMTVETPYGALEYPIKWDGLVQITRLENNGVLTLFFAGTVAGERYPLFEIVFGGEGELNWGWITQEDGTQISVGVNYAAEPEEPQWGTEELDLFCAMQEDSNYLMASALALENFTESLNLTSSTVSATEPVEPVVVDAPYALLTFPGEWAELLTTAVEDDGTQCAVHFSGKFHGGVVELFVIHFGGEGEFLLGTLPDGEGGTVTVSYDFCMLQFDETWTQEEMDQICAMQEGVNSLIEALQLTEGFVPST